MNHWQQVLRQLTLVTQLGLSIVTPPLLLLYLAYRLHFGALGMILALLVGLISSGCGVWRIWKQSADRAEQDAKKEPTSFDRHE